MLTMGIGNIWAPQDSLRSSPQATVSPRSPWALRGVDSLGKACLASDFRGWGFPCKPRQCRTMRQLRLSIDECEVKGTSISGPAGKRRDGRVRARTPAPIPRARGSAVAPHERRGGGRSWAHEPVPVNAFAQLYRPSVSPSGVGHRRKGGRGQTHFCFWPYCLGGSQGGSGLAGPCCMALVIAAASLQPRPHCCRRVRTCVMYHEPMSPEPLALAGADISSETRPGLSLCLTSLCFVPL